MNQHSSIIGFCIPTYNRSGLLATCLETIIPQCIPFNCPIYISDNGSNDETTTIVNEFQKKYKYIFYHRFDHNQGAYVNILNVIKMAQTEYIWLMGDDDGVIDRGLERVINYLSSGTDFLVVNAISFDNTFRNVLAERIVPIFSDKFYPPGTHELLLSDLNFALYYAFMSSMIVRRRLMDSALRECSNTSFLYYGVSWLPLMLFYKSIVNKSGIFIAEPTVMNRPNLRSDSKGLFKYFIAEYLMAFEYLLPEYNEKVLVRVLNIETFLSKGALRIAGWYVITRSEGVDLRSFIEFVKSSSVVPVNVRMFLGLLSKLPPNICRALKHILDLTPRGRLGENLLAQNKRNNEV